MDLPLIGSYDLEAKPHSVQRTVNLIPVPQEPGNERTGWVLKDVKGLDLFSTADVTPEEAVYWDVATVSPGLATWDITDSNTDAVQDWSTAGASPSVIRSNAQRSTGKLYLEIEITVASVFASEVQREVGICDIAEAGSGTIGTGVAYRVTTGQVKKNGATVNTGPTVGIGDVVQFAVDLDTNDCWVGVNGTWVTGNPATATSPTVTGMTAVTYRPAICTDSPITIGGRIRGETSRFLYSVPSGFVAWGVIP